MKLSQLVVAAVVFISSTFSLFAEGPRYIITDLGALGYFSSVSRAVNNYGQVTGYLPFNGGTHAFVTDTDGNMIDLGTLGGVNSVGNAINDSGQVTGRSNSVDGPYHAFVTDSNNNMIDLGTFGGVVGGSSSGSAINNKGQVTGGSETGFTTNPPHAEHAFVTDNDGKMIDLGTLGGRHSYGVAINDSGQVTGRSNITTNSSATQTFITDSNGDMVKSHGSNGVAINNNGQITGQVGRAGAFVTDIDGNMIDLGTGYVKAINESGIVTGYSSLGNAHAFVTDSRNNVIDLGTLGGTTSHATDINDSGQVIGRSYTANGVERAFITDSDDNMVLLSELVDNFSNNWSHLTIAQDISNAGYITGNGSTKDGKFHAFLLTPLALVPKAPAIIVEPKISGITEISAVVSWETDIPATSVVSYGLIGVVDEYVSSVTLTTKHSVVLTDLTVGTHYYVYVTSVDENGNKSEVSRNITFTTLADTTPPVFTVAPVNKTVETTDLLTQVDLGNVSARDNISPVVTISNDAPGASFPLGVTIVTWSATDMAGNVATATQVITLKGTIPEKPIVSISTNGLNVTLAWNFVDGASGYKLYYAPYPYTGPESISFIDVGSSHDFSIELWEGAAYYVAIKAYNSAGESDYSNIEQFSLK